LILSIDVNILFECFGTIIPTLYGVGIIKKYVWAGKQKSPPVYGVGIKIIRGWFCEFYIL
jgi:hypothetical protein